MKGAPSPYPARLVLLDKGDTGEHTVSAAIYSELPPAEKSADADAPPKLPTEFQLFPAGEFETTKGIFLFDDKAAESVMKRAKDWGNKYPVDYGHAMVDDKPVDPAESGKAAGWFDLQVRDGALWAVNVEWTPAGASFLTTKEYRHHSPAFKVEEKTRRITELVNTALTNLPATKGQAPLVASRTGEEPQESPVEPKVMTVILSALQLTEKVTEQEAVATIAGLKHVSTEIFTLTGKTDTIEAVRELRSWQKDSIELKVVRAQLAKSEEKSRATRVEQLVTAALEAGKLIPAQEEWAKGYGEKDLPGLEAFLEAAQPIVTLADGKPSREKPGVRGKSAELTKDDRAIAAQLGVDLKALAKHKAKKIAEDDDEASLLEDDEEADDDEEGARKKGKKARKKLAGTGPHCDDDED